MCVGCGTCVHGGQSEQENTGEIKKMMRGSRWLERREERKGEGGMAAFLLS